MDAPIILFSGPPGAGKSTLSKALLSRYPFGFHIPVDDLREWVVSGIAHPVPAWTDETTRQFLLARRAAAQLARHYADAGFAVAIDDIITSREVDEIFASALAGRVFFRVLLLPSLQTALRRNLERVNKSFDTAVLDEPIRGIHGMFDEQERITDKWLVMDTTDLSVEKTVDNILAKLRQIV